MCCGAVHCVAVVLQCVAVFLRQVAWVYYYVLQCSSLCCSGVAVRCSVFKTSRLGVLLCGCNAVQQVAVVLQCVAVCCSVLQCVAVCCIALYRGYL